MRVNLAFSQPGKEMKNSAGKISHARKFAEHVVPQVIKPARTVWNQVIGTFFLIFAAAIVPSIVRDYRALDEDPHAMVRLILAVCFCALMAFFGISSFLRARRISRS